MTIGQKSHHQIGTSMWILDFDQSVEGLKDIHHSNELTYTKKNTMSSMYHTD